MLENPLAGYGQVVPERYGNNPTGINWRQIKTAHFKIVFRDSDEPVAQRLARQAESIFSGLKKKLGTAPSRKINIYYNGGDELVSDIDARNTDSKFSIWLGRPLILSVPFLNPNLKTKLRREVAYAFQEDVKYFPVDYYYYLFSRPSKTPWSDGLAAYLATPGKNPLDVATARRYSFLLNQRKQISPSYVDGVNRLLGRIQLQYFTRRFDEKSFATMYSRRGHLFGFIPYFNFNPAFKHAAGINYRQFTQQWRKDLLKNFGSTKAVGSSESEFNISQLRFPEVWHYQGAAVNFSDSLAAAITIPVSGSYVQNLGIARLTPKNEVQQLKTISTGYFEPQMDWSPAQNKLAFAKRYYDSTEGSYKYKIGIWEATDDAIKYISREGSDELLPAFSGSGRRLVYISHKMQHDFVMIKNLSTGENLVLHSFERSERVTHLDFRQNGDQVLVSYNNEGMYRLGLLEVGTRRFRRLSVHPQVPPHASWGPDGETVYLNKTYRGVSNIFKTTLTDGQLLSPKMLTNQPLGVTLLGAAVSPSAKVVLTGLKEEADFNNRLAIIPQPAPAPSSQSMALNRGAIKADSNDVDIKKERDYPLNSYHAFGNIQWEEPLGVPYIYGGDYGLGGYLSLAEPLRIHSFSYYGSVSFNDPLHKSYFYSEYINNMFRPQLKLAYNHLPAASGFFGPEHKKAKTVDAVALISLWKLRGLSRHYSDWYAGLMLRYLAFDYFSPATLQQHFPNVNYENTKTRQTDLRATLAWRSLKPGRNTLIHPLQGKGVRLSITASDDILGSQVRYARFNLDAYTILPGGGKNRFYLYGNGVVDAGEPAGRDYLNFSQSGDYQLPNPDFTNDVNPGIQRFVRGYSDPLLGNRFLFGRLEYRIPFEFNTAKKLFGFIPPARTSFTFFTDGGVLGHARTAPGVQETKYRYSIGAEIKRVFSFGGNFQLTYELGIAQPLTKSFGPTPVFNIKSALPF